MGTSEKLAGDQTVMFEVANVISKTLLQFPVLFSQLEWFFLSVTCGLLPHNRNRLLWGGGGGFNPSVQLKHVSLT